MAEYLIQEETLNALADVVREKFGINKELKINEIIDTINDFSGNSTEAEKKGINFYDYDGTLLYTYTVEEFASATNLPPLPTQEGLICQGWNWSLEDIKAAGREVDVGAIYITDDGNTRLYIHLEEGYTSPMIGLGVDGTVTVDWGDGSEPDVLTGTSLHTAVYTSNHEYRAAGDYVITLIVNGEIRILGKPQNGSCILKHSSAISVQNVKYLSFLQKIKIGNSITSIGDYAFSDCCNLTSINIPDSITRNIGNNAFYYCRNLTFINIPNSITSIGNNAFYYCYNLTSINIPDSITSIGGYVFSDCCNLTSVNIPNSITSIGNNVFQNCYNLTSINIPDSITSIGNYVFQNCHNLTSINIPDNITSIGNYAFSYCRNLTSINIPNSITSIGNNVFYYCYNLTSINIPNSITSIGSGAFNSCRSLAFINIPSSVTSIGSSAFSYCYNMCFYDFTGHTAVPTLSATNAFNGIQTGCEIRVPMALYDEWIQATNWTTYRDYIVGV